MYRRNCKEARSVSFHYFYDNSRRSQTSIVVGLKTIREKRCDNMAAAKLPLLKTRTKNYRNLRPCGAVFWARQWGSAPTREEEDVKLDSSLIAEVVVALEERRDEIFDSPAVARAEQDACWKLMIPEFLAPVLSHDRRLARDWLSGHQASRFNSKTVFPYTAKTQCHREAVRQMTAPCLCPA